MMFIELWLCVQHHHKILSMLPPDEGTQHAQKVAAAAFQVAATTLRIMYSTRLFCHCKLRAQKKAAANSRRAVRHAVALAH
jgi:hypothetical protein